MRKLLCLLAILALTAPLFAGTITLTVVDNHNGTCTVGYETWAGTFKPVGLAVEVVAGTGDTISKEDLSLYDPAVADSFFDVFIDYAANHTNYADPGNADPATGAWLGVAHPLAAPGTTAGALAVNPTTGVLDVPRQDVSICMGSLVGDAPTTPKSLAILTIADGATTGVIDLDTIRGGVVDAGGQQMTVTWKIDGVVDSTPPINFTVTNECYAGQADYAQWVLVGKPTCWCYPRQCHGDANGCQQTEKGLQPFWVGSHDLTILSTGWKKPNTDPAFSSFVCADFDHISHSEKGIAWSFRVGGPDLTILSTYWKAPNAPHLVAPPADCLPGNRVPATCP
jgi:hypothetical protein